MPASSRQIIPLKRSVWPSTDEVAAALQISSDTVRAWCDAGLLGCAKVGSHYRVSWEDVDRYLAGQRPSTVDEDELLPVIRKLVRRVLGELAQGG